MEAPWERITFGLYRLKLINGKLRTKMKEVYMDTKNITKEMLAGMIDHTNLKAYATDADLEKLCDEARTNKFAMIAINGVQVKHCHELLAGSGVHVGATVSFPLGQMTIEGKAFECEDAIKNGADEIDYVLNIGRLRMGDLSYIEKEMQVIVDICRKYGVLSKVIFEYCYLTKDEIRAAAEVAKKVRPDFIKTSTGFGTGGATVEDVALMKSVVGDSVKVKAAGGIRTWADTRAMIEAGAERIGTSAGPKILAEFEAETSKN